MSEIDASFFLDVADALGISSPAIVEKDYWATQFLKEISTLNPTGYQLVFSGGTCLSKAHQNGGGSNLHFRMNINPKLNRVNI